MSWRWFCQVLVLVFVLNDWKNLDNCSKPIPHPRFSSLLDRSGAPSGNFNVSPQCCTVQCMSHMFVWDWKQSTETDTGSKGMWAPEGFRFVSWCISRAPCDTPLLCPVSAPGLTGLPASRGNMKVSCFPLLRKQYKVYHNIKQLFHPTPHPSERFVPLVECSGWMLTVGWFLHLFMSQW